MANFPFMSNPVLLLELQWHIEDANQIFKHFTSKWTMNFIITAAMFSSLSTIFLNDEIPLKKSQTLPTYSRTRWILLSFFFFLFLKECTWAALRACNHGLNSWFLWMNSNILFKFFTSNMNCKFFIDFHMFCLCSLEEISRFSLWT